MTILTNVILNKNLILSNLIKRQHEFEAAFKVIAVKIQTLEKDFK